MAISKGKYEVKIKASTADNIGIPKVSNTNYIMEAAEPILDVIKAYGKNALLDHSATFKGDFNTKTTDAYINFNKTFKNNPEQMKVATEAYNQSIIDNTPLAYKEYVTAILAAKYLNAMGTATNNRINLDSELALSNSISDRKNSKGDISANFNNISQNPALNETNKVNQINYNTATIAFDKLNQNAGDDMVNLLDTDRIKKKAHIANINTAIKETEIERIFNIAASLETLDAIKYFTNYANGKDDFPIDYKLSNYKGGPPDSERSPNPIFDMHKSLLKDTTERHDIVTKALAMYRTFNGDKFTTSGTSGKVNLDKEYEIGGNLHYLAFKNGSVTNVHNHVMSIPFMELGSAQYNTAIKKATELQTISGLVSNKLQNEDVRLHFTDSKQKDDYSSAVLSHFGINNTDDLLSADTSTLGVVANILKKDNIIPKVITEYLTEVIQVNYAEPGIMKDFKNKLTMYEFLTSDSMFPHLKGTNLGNIEWAIANDVLGMSDQKAALVMNNQPKDKELEKIKDSFVAQFADDGGFFGASGTHKLNMALNKELGSRSLFFGSFIFPVSDTWFISKFWQGEENIHAKHLYKKTTHWIPNLPSQIMKPQVKAKFQEFFLDALVQLAPDAKTDIWAEKNSKLRGMAFKRALSRLHENNYGVNEWTADGNPKLEKNPIHFTFGKIRDNDIYAHIKSDIALNGLKKWEGIEWEDAFKNYADGHEDYKIVFRATGANYAPNEEEELPEYRMSFLIGDARIDFIEPFYPKGFENMVDEKAPATVAQVTNEATKLAYEKFKKTKLHSLLSDDQKHWSKKMIMSIIKMDMQLSDFRMYPDLPDWMREDVPAEIRPFVFLQNALLSQFTSFQKTKFEDYDLREDHAKYKVIADETNAKIAFAKKVKSNSQLTSVEKNVQSLYPPNQVQFHEAENSAAYKHWALANYNKETILDDNGNTIHFPLSVRTNNWTAIKSDNWEGELDLNYTRDGGKFSVFSHPSQSIRATTRLILNHSSLTLAINDIEKEFSENPTILEILEKIPYAENLDAYKARIENDKYFSLDTTIDLMDADQMHRFLKFIVMHELGGPDAYHYWFKNDNYVDIAIMKGYKSAIASYEGRLGKL